MTIKRILAFTALVGAAALAWGYWTATSSPVVRDAEVNLVPPGSSDRQLRVLLLSDIHVGGPDMSPTRLLHIVKQANALRPDAVLIAGDLISDKHFATRSFSFGEAVSPLRDLRSRFGTFAVLGNHDHWRDARAAEAAMLRAGINVLSNNAVRAGPLVIGGLDDAFTGHDDLGATLRAMDALGGAPILLSHSPDPFPHVPSRVKLMLAGHTHCGQIRLPLVGAISYMSEHGAKYACGVVTEDAKTLIVGAGLGTSLLPLRFGAVPDMWIVTLNSP
ncbi:metallophosphoesterase [Sphingomonas xinjiangensis]|uniref:Calcineurin-like phosphoesterase domain-containing protein n=1 Tax=Sphingomonas xinjiangensis TaxID=643568 RepID=A0A840YIQ4_9SPHN|nr:metallophosphoesterase [Sphingomonas xinjiangensis]MBB5712335.1 hypothetical protein [Sphingomonas xinjiangensis]